MRVEAKTGWAPSWCRCAPVGRKNLKEGLSQRHGDTKGRKTSLESDVRFVTVGALLEMKRDAGRDKDLINIEALNRPYEA